MKNNVIKALHFLKYVKRLSQQDPEYETKKSEEDKRKMYSLRLNRRHRLLKACGLNVTKHLSRSQVVGFN